MISVLIATVNRPSSIARCVKSIIQGRHSAVEIIIVDQSESFETQKALSAIKTDRLLYMRTTTRGKAGALNAGLFRAKGDIIAFTDDDCIADKNWLRIINTMFSKNREVAGYFGSTHPFGKRAGKMCPATILNDRRVTIVDPYTLHYKTLGVGNNMAIRSSVLRRVGGFERWLGPGAHPDISGGEDSEMIYRILKHGYSLVHEPSMTIYHNRWISPQDEEKLQWKYSASLLAYIFFTAIKERDFYILLLAFQRISNRIQPKFRSLVIHAVRFQFRRLMQLIVSVYYEIKYMTFGIFYGIKHTI